MKSGETITAPVKHLTWTTRGADITKISWEQPIVKLRKIRHIKPGRVEAITLSRPFRPINAILSLFTGGNNG
jgi:hypothetical protein